MAEPIETVEGWFALHDFRTLDWSKWRQATERERTTTLKEFETILTDWNEKSDQGSGSFGVYATLGHKADLLLVNFRPDMEELLVCQQRLNRSLLVDFFRPQWSYLSVVELSQYVHQSSSDTPSPEMLRRLHPPIPDKRYICFYPMNKRRQGTDNWYQLSAEERREMMRSHGMIGRRYAGKIIQIITGSQGLDDWEWGVSLFSDDPVQFKKIVYEMRFDEVSARFADFGQFVVGIHLTPSAFKRFFTI